jgi:hypothetical protein
MEPAVEVGVVSQLLTHHQRLFGVLLLDQKRRRGTAVKDPTHRCPQEHKVWAYLLNELQSLEGHLPAAYVQAGQDLVVGRRRRVREERLSERALHRSLEVLFLCVRCRVVSVRYQWPSVPVGVLRAHLIADVDHRSLSQSRQRLVGRLSGVHTDTDLRTRHTHTGHYSSPQ